MSTEKLPLVPMPEVMQCTDMMVAAAIETEREQWRLHGAKLLRWKNAVIEALVVAGIYRGGHDDPPAAVNELLCWQQQVALDPAVSKEAAELHAEIKAGDLHRDINRRVAEALGQKFGESWHDLPEKVAALDRKYRQLLWSSHGHEGQYGDDGEMQCGKCAKYGVWDYKRAPLADVEATYGKAQLERFIKQEEN
jgi:hypothetical protein